MEISVGGFRNLEKQAEANYVRLMTENWLVLLSTPENMFTLLGTLDGQVGLCLDFVNWNRKTRHKDLTKASSSFKSCHTKAHFTTSRAIDTANDVRCLNLAQDPGFSGPHRRQSRTVQTTESGRDPSSKKRLSNHILSIRRRTQCHESNNPLRDGVSFRKI